VTTFSDSSEQIAQNISELKATVIAAASVNWRLCSTSSEGRPPSATITAELNSVILDRLAQLLRPGCLGFDDSGHPWTPCQGGGDLYGDGLPYGNGRSVWTLMTGRCVSGGTAHRRRLEYGCSSLHGGEADATCSWDRNRILCEALAATLRARCHQVLAIAPSATGCIAAVAAHRPDACLLDPRFPDESGLEAAQVIRPLITRLCRRRRRSASAGTCAKTRASQMGGGPLAAGKVRAASRSPTSPATATPPSPSTPSPSPSTRLAERRTSSGG